MHRKWGTLSINNKTHYPVCVGGSAIEGEERKRKVKLSSAAALNLRYPVYRILCGPLSMQRDLFKSPKNGLEWNSCSLYTQGKVINHSFSYYYVIAMSVYRNCSDCLGDFFCVWPKSA